MDKLREPIFAREFETFYTQLPKWLAQGVKGFALIKGSESSVFETQNAAINAGEDMYKDRLPFLVEPISETREIIIANDLLN
ncbi:MAG TPA: hypothetical protein VMR76_00420 [Candidatus Saccharimonadia bacterium]|nr:hypothetical protein [Candidatus Saccharimonadia bacterium]